jgi:hypothetical protein
VVSGQLQGLLLEPESGGGTLLANLWPPTPKVEHLSPKKHEGMWAVGQTVAPKEALVGAVPTAVAPG